MGRNLWARDRRLPPGIRAVLASLHLSHPERETLRSLDERAWQAALSFCDRTQLTLVFGRAAGGQLPEWVRARIERNLRDNTERLEQARAAALEIDGAFHAAGVEYAVLKGFTQSPRYVPDPRLRVQYDLDLYCPPEPLLRAREVLLGLGYEPLRGFESYPLDHLPAMVRKTGWQWRGDYFDPGMPVSVDLHFRFWDEATERLEAPGLDAFWERRTGYAGGGRCLPVLDPADALGYTALHLLRHVLRGSLRPYHAYELACFLHAHAADEAFWNRWTELHQPRLKRLEAVAFQLAAEWFGCRLPGAAAEQVEALPEETRLWFERSGAAPVRGLIRPNKDELWLHLALLASAGDKLRVLRRRLLPVLIPAPVDAVHVPEAEKTLAVRWRARAKYSAWVAGRAGYHLRTLAPALVEGARWWNVTRGPGRAFWRFLLTASLYHFGVYIFVLLYNLYLLDRGFQEDFLGLIASATTLGSIAGALPAGWFARRRGLKPAMLACFAGTGAVQAARCLVTGEWPLAVTAFLGGVLASLWFVLIAPAVSGLTGERNRPLGFSLFVSAGIGVGIVGGLAGGQLPRLLGGALGLDGAQAKQAAMLAGCAITALAAWPASRLKLPAVPHGEAKTYPWSPFLARFLAAIAVWSFATGSFNPFFNAYLSRQLHASEAGVGLAFSAAQLVQVAAVLLAPVILRKFGLVRGISGFQAAAAAALALTAFGPPLLAAGALYVAYMSCQSMSEPGTFSLLMNHVRPEERSGASSLTFLAMFLAQAAAALAGGAVVARFGYPVMLGAAAGIAGLAALMFRGLLRAAVSAPRTLAPARPPQTSSRSSTPVSESSPSSGS